MQDWRTWDITSFEGECFAIVLMVVHPIVPELTKQKWLMDHNRRLHFAPNLPDNHQPSRCIKICSTFYQFFVKTTNHNFWLKLFHLSLSLSFNLHNVSFSLSKYFFLYICLYFFFLCLYFSQLLSVSSICLSIYPSIYLAISSCITFFLSVFFYFPAYFSFFFSLVPYLSLLILLIQRLFQL